MPYAVNRGARIYWESHGEGEPLVLLMGLSFTLDLWHRSLPYLTHRYRTILLDNRGVGRSSVPRGPYSVPLMARDVAAVMDAAGVERAHLIGASMGGMIAQEFALRFPHRVRSLILGCTSCGILRGKWPKAGLLRVFRRWRRITPAERTERLAPLLYSPRTPPERIAEDVRIRLANYPRERGYLNQLLGMIPWSSYRRLPRIEAPTLILHGEQDPLMPVGNAFLLARRIPNARLVILPNASHFFTTDQPELAHRIVLDFLASL